MPWYEKTGRKLVWTWILLAGFCGAAYAGSGTVYYDLAVFAFEEGNYPEAENYLAKALAERPDDAWVHFYLARTHLKQGRLTEAETLIHSAWALDPHIPGLAYEMGILYQKMEKYGQALASFDAVIADNPAHVTALYHAGVCSFMLDQYRRAVDYFTRASELSESVRPTAAYYAGICHFRLSEFDRALPEFDYAASAADTPAFRRDAQAWARAARMRIGRDKPWRLFAKAGWLYDDNVQLAPLDSDQFTEESDSAAVFFFSGRYAVAASDRLNVGMGYNHYQTFYNDFDDYNLIGAIPEIFAEYRMNRITVGLAYIPAYYWVDTESYLMQHQARPEIRYRLTDKDELGFAYSYARNNYFEDSRRDGHAHDFMLNYLRGLDAVNGSLFFMAGYQDNSASHPDEYFTEMTGRVGASASFFDTFGFRVQGEYTDKNYDNRDSFHRIKREDSRYGASAALSWQFPAEWPGASVEYAYTRNDSNIAEYDYRRNTVALFLTADF
jgi:tetratricopeptide (TPR) repeat protein